MCWVNGRVAGGELLSLASVMVSDGHAWCLKIGIIHHQWLTTFSLCIKVHFLSRQRGNLIECVCGEGQSPGAQPGNRIEG